MRLQRFSRVAPLHTVLLKFALLTKPSVRLLLFAATSATDERQPNNQQRNAEPNPCRP
jgi:hypothetical protein